MTNNKVVLPKEVAEAIKELRRQEFDTKFIVMAALGDTLGSSSKTIRRYTAECSGNFDLLMQALVNGYEVEQTPEDNLREYFEYLKKEHRQYAELDLLRGAQYNLGEYKGIERALNILGIKIEGVNV